MSVMQMVGPLLRGVELTPSQLTELRAIDTMYYSTLASAPPSPSGSPRELEERVLARVREMLHADQRASFDRNCAAGLTGETRDGAPFERQG
ncbi:MAG: hypothetical protein ABI889_06875 [Gemmatimonadota bacterium]